MPNPFLGGGNAGAGSTTTSGGTLVSPTADPTFASLAALIQSLVPQQGPDLASYINAGTNSPLLQAILQPALAQYEQGAGTQRQALTDAARSAGAQRSGAYLGSAIPNLEASLAQGRGNLIGQLTSQTLAPLLQSQLSAYNASFNPANALTNLLSALKPALSGGSSSSSSARTGWEGVSPSLGLDTPMGSSTLPSTQGPGYGTQPSGPSMNEILRALGGGGGANPPPTTVRPDLGGVTGGGPTNRVTYNPTTGFWETTSTPAPDPGPSIVYGPLLDRVTSGEW